MFTTAPCFLLLFVSRVFANILVSDVYDSQSQCDTSVDVFKNSKGETPCTVALQLLVPCNVNVTDSNTAEITLSACVCNVAFYNLLSACALFCVKASVDPFYVWTQNCSQVVPMSQYYPWPEALNTVIPPWASKRLSSGGNFDPSAVMKDSWSNVQKVTPVIVGLGVLVLVGLFWWLYRTHRRHASSRRAQNAYPGTNRTPAHRRGESAGSYSSTSHLNSPNTSQVSLPVHRIRFFFSGMFPVRERRRDTGWNIEGDPGLSRRTPAVYDPPSHRDSNSFSTPTPSIHAQNDLPPTPTAATWPPFQRISRWWASISPSKGRDYQAVHLAPTRKNSKFDDDYVETALVSPPLQNRASNVGNGQIPSVVAISDSGGVSVPHPQTSQPVAEPTSPTRLPILRPNRLGDIVATEDTSLSQPLPSPDAPTTGSLTPNLSAFPSPPEIRQQMSNETFHTSRTNLSIDQESEQTIKPKKLSPELLFPPSVRAAGYSVPPRPDDPVTRAWIPRMNSTSNRHARNATSDPPLYQQSQDTTTTLHLPSPQASTHPYPYTNHLRSTSDVTVLNISRSPRSYHQDLETIDTQGENMLNRLSLAVNEPTSAHPTTSENGSGDGYTDFTPVTIVHGSDALKNLQYTPYPSSTMLPSSSPGVLRGGHPPSTRS